MEMAYIIVLLCGAAAVAYGIITGRAILAEPAGNARMQEIANAIKEGASAYLKRQYMTISVVGGVIFLITWVLLGFLSAFGFLIGAALSSEPLKPRGRA